MKTTSEALKDFVEKEYQTSTVMRFNKHYRHYLEEPVDDKAIFMEVRDGHSFVGNVKAIYEALLKDDRFHDYHFYISYDSEDEKAAMQQWMTVTSRTHFVQRLTEPYAKALATSRYLFNNSTFIASFMKRDNQCYINTWHGTPLKHMGFDLPGIKDNQNVLRNFLMTDYLISPNEHTTYIFKDRYKLEGIYEGVILEGGYPRIDTLIDADPMCLIDCAKAIGISLDSQKKTLLYTPTWRGSDVHQAVEQLEILEAEVEALQQSLTDWNILVKVHPFIAKKAQKRPKLKSVLLPDAVDVNEWLSCVDVLVTDYSSIFFDFLVTDKPVIFYCPDYLHYQHHRGLYFDKNDLPGRVVTTIDDLIEAINTPQKEVSYEKMKRMMVPYDDGCVTKRYIDTIFFGKDNMKAIKCQNNKKKLLLYAGGMKNNGITTALLNLCNALDEQEYDITIFLGGTLSKEIESNIHRLPKTVRLMFHLGYPIYNKEERLADKILTQIPTEEHYQSYYSSMIPAYQREARRIFANISFDVAIDFSGYAYFWAKYILFANAKRHLIYLHNDIQEEIALRAQHSTNLKGVALLYRHFDALVNVSVELKTVNAQKLNKIVSPNKHVVASNFIDLDWKQHHSVRKIEQYSTQGKLVEKTSFFKVSHPTKISLYTLPDHHASTHNIEVTPTDIIDSPEIYDVNKKRYYRLRINGLEKGWYGEDGTLLPAGYPILEKIPMDCLGKVSRRHGHAYVLPTDTELPPVSAGGLSRLYQSSIFIEQKIITPVGSYYVAHSGEWKGTLAENAVTLGEKGNRLLDASAPTYSQAVHRFFKIENTSAPIYSSLKGFAHTKEIGQAKDLKRDILYNIWEMRNGYGTFYQYQIDGKQGWIDANDVRLISDPHMLVRKEEKGIYRVHGTSIIVYSDETSLFSGEYEIVSEIQGVLEVHEKLWTQRGIFYRVSGFYNGLVEERAISEKVVIGQLKDIDGKPIIPFNNNRKHYVTMGRLSPEKNHEALIEGFHQWMLEHPQEKDKVDLLILGDGELKDTLKTKIQEYHLQHHVYLLGHRHDTADILSQCHGFIFPSLYEGQGLALLEAMMLNLPVAATDIPVLRQVLGDGRYGYLIPGTQAQDIAKVFDQFNHCHKENYETFSAEHYQKEGYKQFQRVLFPTWMDKVRAWFKQ